LFNTIDQLNFSPIPAHTSLGWLGRSGISGLKVVTASGENVIGDLFAEDKGFLVTTRPMTLFMATTDPYIAQRDCLLYLTPDQSLL
ncbi:MAG: hypothetical protein HUJ31_10690, partial [Pseudomonadales bacterium]|nr:hypothetical protein [Pseudomonadales bacterium]